MPSARFSQTAVELRLFLQQERERAKQFRTEAADLRVRLKKTIAESRETMARADDVFGVPGAMPALVTAPALSKHRRRVP
jgi:hypothetical protein